MAEVHTDEYYLDEPSAGGAGLMGSRPTLADHVPADEHSEVHAARRATLAQGSRDQVVPVERSDVSEARRAITAALLAPDPDADVDEQPTRLFAGQRATPVAGSLLQRVEAEQRTAAPANDTTETDVEPAVRRAPALSRREHTLPRPAVAASAPAFPTLPGPTPPSAAKAQAGTRRPIWFYPSLVMVTALSVLGALALVSRGAPEAREISVHSLTGVAHAAPGHGADEADAPIVRPAPLPAASRGASPSPVPASPSASTSPSETSGASAAADSDEDEEEDTDDEEQPATRSSRSRQAKANMGILRVTSSVPAAVYVDGKYVGTTPLRRVSLRPGKHKLALENAVMGQSARLSIRIKAGVVLKKDVELDLEQ